MKSLRLLLCVFVFVAAEWQNSLSAQQVLMPDILYISEQAPPKIKYESSAFSQFYSLPQLLDTIQRQKLRAAIEKINSDFPKQPLKIEGCVYFDAFAKSKLVNTSFSSWYFFSKHFPPSLRFSTDGNKNHIDSLYSMRLFPKASLEKYAQPFYFKKTEVTNAEYREFVSYVRDSVARRILAKNGFEDSYLLSEEQLIRKGWDPDSIDNINKEYWPLNTKEEVHWSTESEDYKAALHEIYLPENQRFWRRKEIDKGKMNYVYFTNEHNETHKHVINIYPDTLCWVHDHLFLDAENRTNLYYWHPGYDKYPVVGISFEQAKAFLDWKTKTEQQKLNAKGVKYSVEYALPTEIEWEIAATSEKQGDQIVSYTEHFPALGDFSWATDLVVDSFSDVKEKRKVIVDTVMYKMGNMGVSSESKLNAYIHHDDTTLQIDGDWYRRTIRWYYWSQTRKPFTNDNQLSGYSHPMIDNQATTTPADLEKIPLMEKRKWENISGGKKEKYVRFIDNSVLVSQLDKNGISFMGGNVSEWLDEDYSDWLPAFTMRLKQLQAVGTPDAEMEYRREFYYNTFNDQNGKLVRGANWFDERYGNFLDKNPAGTNAKIFVDPKKTRCTIGFRYVVRVGRK
jgi:formylglycine-generating enzyme required for sulfatase activity